MMALKTGKNMVLKSLKSNKTEKRVTLEFLLNEEADTIMFNDFVKDFESLKGVRMLQYRVEINNNSCFTPYMGFDPKLGF